MQSICKRITCIFLNYFLGVNDCGDNSDEPANCQNDCSIALSAYAPEKICDANLDCIGEIIFFSNAPVPLHIQLWFHGSQIDWFSWILIKDSVRLTHELAMPSTTYKISF